ncbi:GGDEF domain-containing protein [Micromonospora sp. NIE79]|uniref:GGDEF domain-containing protein n=1 Tax=Micromonospora trifolii TaxID=2911208 RepID=A0ABS9N8C6_9ACTN|nr:GGDEF domain-containing protein [Micromonospora trifolii]MCG5446221.1 GGDEF domain-containing protein [Micromonospora trifolii]
MSTFAQITAVVAALTLTAAITAHLTGRRTAGRYRAALTAAVQAAHRDDLTGLGNRAGFRAALAAASARRRPVAVMVVNLDGTRTVVGRFGDRALDQLLVLTAGRLAHVASAGGGAVFRMRRDEFAVILDDPAAAPGHAGRLVAAVADPTDLRITGHRITVTVTACAGVAVFTPHEDPDQRRALGRADRAMRAAKTIGRGRTAVFDPVRMRGHDRPPAPDAGTGTR